MRRESQVSEIERARGWVTDSALLGKRSRQPLVRESQEDRSRRSRVAAPATHGTDDCRRSFSLPPFTERDLLDELLTTSCGTSRSRESCQCVQSVDQGDWPTESCGFTPT